MITVWGRRSSINVQKVLWALGETGVKFERETVGGQFGGNDTKEFKKLNPMGLVPVVKDGTLVLFESNAILRYVARRYGRGTIIPRGYRALGLAERWVEWTQSTAAPAVGAVFMQKVRTAPEQADAKVIAQGTKQAAAAFRLANRMLGKKPFVTGRHFTYGDIPLGALYWRYRNLEIDRPQLPNLERWFEQLEERKPYRDYVKVPIGRNLKEWTANEKKLK